MHVSSPLYLFQDMCGVRRAKIYSIPHITGVKEREHTYTTRMVERPDEREYQYLHIPQIAKMECAFQYVTAMIG